MKLNIRTIAMSLAAVSMLSLSGCDMFRRLAGRPTAEELEEMRIEKLRVEEARHQARIDSLTRVAKEKRDSIAIIDSIMQMEGTILNPSDIGGLFTTRLDSRYYVVVGAFKARKNAEKLFNEISDEGYSPILVNFRNGFNAIAMCPSDHLADAFLYLKRIRNERFCPDDVWILVNE